MHIRLERRSANESLSLCISLSLSLSPNVPHAQYRKRFRASYNTERERERRKWRHHCRAKIGDEFCTPPCQKCAPQYWRRVLRFSLPKILHLSFSPFEMRWVHPFHCQKRCTFRNRSYSSHCQMAWLTEEFCAVSSEVPKNRFAHLASARTTKRFRTDVQISKNGALVIVYVYSASMRWASSSSLQYCRVPKNGLPKNGQAGISSKNKNYPRLENELRAVSPHANSFCCEDDFFYVIADFETTPLRRFEIFQPHSPPGMRRRVPCARYKLTYVTRSRIEK